MCIWWCCIKKYSVPVSFYSYHYCRCRFGYEATRRYGNQFSNRVALALPLSFLIKSLEYWRESSIPPMLAVWLLILPGILAFIYEMQNDNLKVI
jgi:hypothetical protein